MFKQWRINRLHVKIAQKEAEAETLERLVHSGNRIPMYYVDNLVATQGRVAALKKKLEQLST